MFKKLIFLLLTTYLLQAEIYEDIKFEGLSQISTTIATETSNFKKNKEYSDEQINNTLKKFYKFGYFNDIVISKKNKILIFSFLEKPFIASLDMSGFKNRDDELDVIYNIMDIKKGNMYTKNKISIAKQKLLAILREEGYVHSVVEVEVTNLSKSSVAIKFLVNKGDEIIIKKVNYIGAKELSADDFEEVTLNKKGDCCFTWFYGRNDGVMKFDQLGYDGFRIKEKYLEKGFLDAKIKEPFARIDFNTNSSVIDIQIDEGKQYKVGKVIIYVDEKIVKPVDIYPELKLRKDKIFNIKKLRKDLQYIKTKVSNKGYAFVNIDYNVKQNKEIAKTDIIYNVSSGEKVYINDVIISGNNRTLDRVIRRNIYLAPQDLFNLTDLNDSKNTLKRTGYFEKVEIKQQRITKNKIDLLVEVSEAPTGNIIFGGGYGSYDKWMINASINDKNIFGSGLDLGFSIDWSKRKTNFKLSLDNPSINDSIYSGSASIFKSKETRDLKYKGTTIDDVETSDVQGLSLGIGRKLTRHTRVGLIYALTKTKSTYDKDITNNLDYITSSLTPYIRFDNTDAYFVPRNGMRIGTSLQYAGVGGDSKFLKSYTYFKYYKGLDDYIDYDLIVRYKAQVQVLKDKGKLLPKDSLYMGGTSSVRGYRSYAFGRTRTDDSPYKKMFANSIELSFPLMPRAKVRWGLFYDYGMIGKEKFSAIKRSGAGALIEWFSPVGPIQFIFSRPLDDKPGDKTSKFEFSLGSQF